MLNLLLNAPLFLVSWPIIVGLLKWKSLPPYMRYLWYYSVYTFGVEWLIFLLALLGIDNLFLVHFAVPVEFAFITLFWLNQGSIKRFKSTLYALMGILVLTSVYETCFVNGWNSLPAISLVLSSTSILLMVFMFFYESLRIPDPSPLLKQPVFYIATAFLVYFGFSVFYFMLYNKINKEFNEVIGSVWHSTVNCISYILLSISFLCIPKVKTT